jgi:hypothetical protein
MRKGAKELRIITVSRTSPLRGGGNGQRNAEIYCKEEERMGIANKETPERREKPGKSWIMAYNCSQP